MKLGKFLACCGALQAMLAATPPAWAQNAAPVLPFNIGGAVRQSEESRQAPLPSNAAAPVLPRLVEPPLTLKDHETLFVRRFKVEGPDLGGEATVREILAPYENRKLTLATIYEATDKVTTYYRNQGYLVAKAYVPAQDARRGVLRIKIVPGQYGAVTVKNQSLVRDDFVHGVIDQARAGSPFIRQDDLERAMLLTSDLPGAGMPRVTIGAGRQPETTDLTFDVPQGRRLDGYLLGDNYGSPFTGRDRLSGGLNVNSPLGYGDRLSVFGILSDHSGLKNGRASYSLPLGYGGLRAEVAAFRTTYALGGIYSNLDATGTADGITASLAYPLQRQRDESIYVSASFTHKSLNDNVLGISLADRRIDLGSVAIARETAETFVGLPLTTSASLSFTTGHVDFPDADQRAANIAGVDTAGQYWPVNLSYLATLGLTDKLSFLAYFRGQKSLFGKNLDSSEQLSLTGLWGVRSFDEGLAGDSGFVVTPELKYALPDFYAYRHSIGVFADVGGVLLENPAFTTTQNAFTQLNDVGLGYYATYEYSPNRFLLLKAQVAHSYGSTSGAQIYNQGTKGLLQAGFTF